MDSVIVETPKEAARRFSASTLAKGYAPVALHVYTDIAGAPLYWRIRAKHPVTGEKWIRPLRLGDSRYELSEPHFTDGKPLYALQRLAENSDAMVWIVEGEQKADELNRLGLVATTSGSATSANTVDAEILRGRTVRLWPDNDEAGARYASDWAEILAGLGCCVTCIDVDALGLDKGGDAVDWLALNPNATRENIEALPLREVIAMQTQKNNQQTTHYLSAPDRIIALDIDELLLREFPPMEPLLSPWLCKQHLSMVYAWRGVGKTHFALGVAYAVAGGGMFLKWKADKPRRVVYIDGEMAGAAIKARLAAIVASTDDAHEPPEGFFKIITPDAQNLPLPDLASPEGQAALAPHIADADLIVVDNLSSLMRAGAENEGESWVPVADWALSMRKLGKAVLFIHHAGKGGQQRGSSRREDLMDVVIKLDHAKDYEAAKGAAFLVNFEKARHLSGDDAKDIEAALTADEHGVQTWVWKDAELGMAERILALHHEDPKVSQSEIAKELGVNRSTVSRALKKAKQHGGGTR
jgi:AAA domain/Homeodomain-like domain